MLHAYKDLTVSIEIGLGPGPAWYFGFEIPDYAGRGTVQRFESPACFHSKRSAEEHAKAALTSEIDRHYLEIEDATLNVN